MPEQARTEEAHSGSKVAECPRVLSVGIKNNESSVRCFGLVGFDPFRSCGLKRPPDEASDSAGLPAPGIAKDCEVSSEEFVRVHGNGRIRSERRYPNHDAGVSALRLNDRT
jgi:hypothetical protein